MLQAILSAGHATAQQIADELGCSRALVRFWETSGRRIGPDYARALEERYGIPRDAWRTWRNEAQSEAASRPATKGTRRAAEEEPPADPMPELETGSVADRLRRLGAWMGRPGRTPAELAQAKEARQILMLEERFGRQRVAPLEEHPDWPQVVELLLDAVADLPGGPRAVLNAIRNRKAQEAA